MQHQFSSVTDPVQPTVGTCLIAQLEAAGIRHAFGIPGDYILKFYEALYHSGIQHIGTTREDTAAFAADAYARCSGLGVVVVTYGVGALSCINAIAGANAESSPVIIVSGAPGTDEQAGDILLHHRFGPYRYQREIFKHICCITAVLDDASTAMAHIEEAIYAAQRHSRPAYIELPRDMVDRPAFFKPTQAPAPVRSDDGALGDAIDETLQLLDDASSPVAVAGVEIQRRHIQDTLVRFVLRARLPVAATLSGKSVVGERHPAYLGIYEGAMGSDRARRAVEHADLVMLLGVTLNDVDLGIRTARLDAEHTVLASHGRVQIGHHQYLNVQLIDFLAGLAAFALPHPGFAEKPILPNAVHDDFPLPGEPIRLNRLIRRLDAFLRPDMQVVADTGDCLFSAIDLKVHQRSEFLASAYYTTMGFAVPAALGAQIARPDLRPLILVGDGAFQMTGTELATCARLGLDPIVIVFNNHGYTTERFILDGPFNDISDWRYERIADVIQPAQGFLVHTEYQLEQALEAAEHFHSGPSIINVDVDASDTSGALRKLSQCLKDRLEGDASQA